MIHELMATIKQLIRRVSVLESQIELPDMAGFLAIDGSNANTTIDIQGQDFVTVGGLGLGTITPSAKLEIKGTTDEIQQIIRANSVQTNPILEIQNSSGAGRIRMGVDGAVSFGSQALNTLYPFQTYYTATNLSGTTYGELHRLNWNGASPSTGTYIGEEHRTTNLAATSLAQIISNLYSTYISNASGSVGIATTFQIGSYVLGSATELTELRVKDYTGGGSVTTHYGLLIENINNATNNYAIYTNAGDVRFGDQLSIIGSADRIQNIIKANAAQTVNLTEWQNSSGVEQTYIKANFGLVTGGDRVKSNETSVTTATVSDDVETHFCNGAGAYVLTLPTQVAGKTVRIINKNTGVVTLTPASGLISGAATKALNQYDSLLITSDGTNWY